MYPHIITRHKGQTLQRKALFLLIISIFLILLSVSPVLAGTKTFTGSPDLSVSIAGSNQFTPGVTVPLNLVIENTGLIATKMMQSEILDQNDLPNSAKQVSVSLIPGDAPVLVKNDPQMIGDIKSSGRVPVTFQIRVTDDARAGKYTLPVRVTYTYLAEAEQQGTESITYRYEKKDLNILIPFVVQSGITVQVENITSNVNSGGEGFVSMTLSNIGADTGKKAIAKLIRSESSPVIPIDGSVYMGEFSPKQNYSVKFKVSVSGDAQPQQYPLTLQVNYENIDGETLNTTPIRIGIPVGGKVDFSVANKPPTISPGEKRVIEIEFRNDGDSPVYSAESRISVVDPFTSNDELAYLGDLKPGETAIARFDLMASGNAQIKLYGLDSEIRYRDALDNSQISDTIKVKINVINQEGFGFAGMNLIIPAILIIIIFVGGYLIYERRKKIPAL